MDIFYNCNHKRDLQQEKQIRIINSILSESKRKKDINGLLHNYIYLANLYYEWNNKPLFNLYLDSADIYAENATNPLALARYHYAKGTQAINVPYGKKEGYKQFEKAVDYYCLISPEVRTISYYVYNISVYTANQPDTVFAKRLIRKVEKLLQKGYSPFLDFSLNAMKADLYSTYFDANAQESMLDSAIFYENKRVELFYANKDLMPCELTYDVLQSYLLIAEYHSMKKNPNREFINDCIKKARSFGYTDDAYILSRIKYTEAISLFEQGKFNEAEILIAKAEKRLLQQISEEDSIYPSEAFYSDQIAQADLHSKILYAKGDFRGALKYAKIRNALRLEMRDRETRELEYLYNTKKDERKIEQLKIINANQIKSIGMLILVAILLITAIVLLWLWFYAAKKSIKRRSALLRAEKEEAELNLKIKEEQAVKEHLEKYEVLLSDYHSKEMELEGKNKAKLQLLEDKKVLDKQIEAYMRKINEFERLNDRKQESVRSGESLNKSVKDDITQLIARKLQDRKDYSESLDRMGEQYISALKKAYCGNLSVPYIKYCVCFAIGMAIGEVSECFSIEQASVHMVRYRLKKKFGLDNNDDLDVFLRKLNIHPEKMAIDSTGN
jgi:hypothetical protein